MPTPPFLYLIRQSGRDTPVPAFRFDGDRLPIQRMVRSTGTKVSGQARAGRTPKQQIMSQEAETLQLSGEYYVSIAGSSPFDDLRALQAAESRIWISLSGLLSITRNITRSSFGGGWIITKIQETGSEPFGGVFQKYTWSVSLVKDA